MAKKSSSNKPKPTPPQEMTFEQAVAELEQIIEQIEQAEIGLEQSLVEKRRGDQLIKRCREILDHAEQELQDVSAAEVSEPAPSQSDSGRADNGT